MGSNHSSFAPQYPDLYVDLNTLVPKEIVGEYVDTVIKASTIDDKLVMLPRAQFDVSALYYQKSLYTDDAKKAAFKAKYGYARAAGDVDAGVRPGAVLCRSAEFLRHPVCRQGRSDQRTFSTKC